MSWIVQDAIVTAVMIGAVAVLARRVVGVIRPSRADAACGACASCAQRPAEPERAAAVVPLNALRRRHQPNPS
jgi:hypothetical protein